MDFHELSNIAKIDKVKGVTSDGTTAIESDSVDMQDYRGVLFLVELETPATDNIVNIAQSANDSDFDDIENSGVVSGTSEIVWVDHYDPRDRYVRCEVARGTSTVVSRIWALRYGARKGPADNNISGTIIGELHIGGIEGTK